jgi:hypothetical protein
MAWIESHQSLGAHPKLRKVSALLGITRSQAVGHLMFLWWWSLDYAPDGDLARYDLVDIALAADWAGDAADFVDALVRAGWIDETDDGFSVHDWDDYAGRLVEKRLADAERKRQARTSSGRPADVRWTSSGRPADVQRTSNVPTQHTQHTEPNRTNTTDARARASEIDPPGFEAFWAVFPNRRDRKLAVAQWRALKPDAVLQQRIVSAVEAHLRSRQWREGFVKAPHRWLRDRNWEDEIPVEPIPIAAARGASRQAVTEAALDAFLAIADGAEA